MTEALARLTAAGAAGVMDVTAEQVTSDPEIVHTTETACPVCGCEPWDAWGCECDFPDCPCSEREDEDDE